MHYFDVTRLANQFLRRYKAFSRKFCIALVRTDTNLYATSLTPVQIGFTSATHHSLHRFVVFGSTPRAIVAGCAPYQGWKIGHFSSGSLSELCGIIQHIVPVFTKESKLLSQVPSVLRSLSLCAQVPVVVRSLVVSTNNESRDTF